MGDSAYHALAYRIIVWTEFLIGTCFEMVDLLWMFAANGVHKFLHCMRKHAHYKSGFLAIVWKRTEVVRNLHDYNNLPLLLYTSCVIFLFITTAKTAVCLGHSKEFIASHHPPASSVIILYLTWWLRCTCTD